MWEILFQIIAIIITSIHAGELFCSFNGNSCSFERIINVTTPNEHINVIGQSSTYNDPMVTFLDIRQSSEFSYFPTEIFHIFPNLGTMFLTSNKWLHMVTNAFDHCDKLVEILSLSQNFAVLAEGFAQNCKILQAVTFNNGQITTLDPNALRGLAALRGLSLHSNKITCLPSDFFVYSPLIENFQITENQLAAIDSSTFRNLPNLYNIDFTDNKISYITNLDLTGSANNNSNPNRFMTVNFNFQNNPIIAMEKHFLTTLFESRMMYQTHFFFPVNNEPYTTCFSSANKEISSYNWETQNAGLTSCYDNWKTSMEEKIFCQSLQITITSTTAAPGSCSSDKICRYYLDYLDRYTCVIDGVDGSLTSISGAHISALFSNLNVTRVYFKNSFLNRIPKVLFKTFENLDFVSVANCSLGMITNVTITNCGKMSYLDARFNEIYRISGDAFKNCQNLKIIDFTGNPIQKLDSNIFKSDPSLKKVILNSD